MPDKNDVVGSKDRRDDCDNIARLNKCQVHQKAGGTSIAVYEWMDVDQLTVHLCCKGHRMHLSSKGWQTADESKCADSSRYDSLSLKLRLLSNVGPT